MLPRNSIWFVLTLGVDKGHYISALLIGGLLLLFGYNVDDKISHTFWNSISTMINSEVPYFEEGSGTFVSITLTTILAIIGLLFTSVLIGFFSSAFEEKIVQLKRGNSLVLEKDHIVVLGFYPGEYTLINQLILASAGKRTSIVVGGDMERDDMEADLEDNIEIPKNINLICRKVDITDPTSIEKCAIQSCRTVIVSPTDDFTTVKAVLAVSALMERLKITGKRINAIVSKNEYRFPPSMADTHNVSTLQTNDIIAKMVAHSCTQTGLSETFREVFNFEGSEFYLIDIAGVSGLTFENLITRVNHATPAGIYRDGKLILNPGMDCVIEENDSILVFSEERDLARLEEDKELSSKSEIPIDADYSVSFATPNRIKLRLLHGKSCVSKMENVAVRPK